MKVVYSTWPVNLKMSSHNLVGYTKVTPHKTFIMEFEIRAPKNSTDPPTWNPCALSGRRGAIENSGIQKVICFLNLMAVP